MAKTVGFTLSVGARMASSVGSVFNTVTGRAAKLKGDLKQLRSLSTVAGKLTTTQARVVDLRAQATAGRDVKDKLNAAERAFASAQRSASKYNLTVADAAKVHAQTTAQINRTESALKRQETALRNSAKRRELQGEIMGTVASVGAIAVPVKFAMDYESSFADLKKAADFASKEHEEQVKQEIFAVAKKTGMSAAQITEIATAAAESGVVKNAKGEIDQELLKEFLTDASQMAVAFGISAEEAGERMKAFRTRMGLSAKETREMADAINYLGANMNATADDTSKVVARMGGVGEMGGLSAKSVAALAATLVATSEAPEVAGTAFKNFILTLSKGERMTKKQRETLASMGISAKEMAVVMKKGGTEAEDAILGLLGSIKKMPEATQAGIANDLFGTESLASLAPVINDLDMLHKAFEMARSDNAIGSMLREFEERSATTRGAVDRMKSSLGIMAIAVGTVVLPAVTAAADAIGELATPVTAFMQANPKVVAGVMAVAGGLVALKVASLAGGFAFTVLSDVWNNARRVGAAVAWVTNLVTTASLRQRGAALAAAAGTRIWTAAQGLLNFAMSNNPVGWLVKGVGVLVGVLAYLYKTCEPVRVAFDAIWSGTVERLKTVWGLVEKVWGGIKKVIDWFSSDESEEAREAAEAEKARTAPRPGTAAIQSGPHIPALPQAPPAETFSVPDLPLQGFGAVPDVAQLAAMGGGPAAIQVTQQITVNAEIKELRKEVLDALRESGTELERILGELLKNHARVAYG